MTVRMARRMQNVVIIAHGTSTHVCIINIMKRLTAEGSVIPSKACSRRVIEDPISGSWAFPDSIDLRWYLFWSVVIVSDRNWEERRFNISITRCLFLIIFQRMIVLTIPTRAKKLPLIAGPTIAPTVPTPPSWSYTDVLIAIATFFLWGVFSYLMEFDITNSQQRSRWCYVLDWRISRKSQGVDLEQSDYGLRYQ